MSLRSVAAATLYGVDDAWCRAVLATAGDRPGLLAFMFHAVGPDGGAPREEACIDPAQVLPVSAYDRFVRHFLDAGYTFVTPEDVRDGLQPDGRFALMTFDDGYFNNFRVLPVLERHEVPAVFFISTNHLAEGKAYWWDVVFRERTASGWPLDRIREEQASMKEETHVGVDEYLVAQFGEQALRPATDGDRPMTPDELRTFSRHPWVRIGSHTTDHAILTNYPPPEVETQILGAQDWLEAVTGVRPISFSYPNGNHSDDVVAAVRACGLDVAVTTRPTRNAVPREAKDRLTVGRFCFTQGQDNPRTFRMYRAGVSPRTVLARLRSG